MPAAPALDRAVGRNTTRITAGLDGLQFRKTFDGDRADALRRYRNSVAWDALQRQRGMTTAPRIVERDDDRLTLVFPYVQDSRTLQEVIDTDEPGADVLPELLASCARLLADVHGVPVSPEQVPARPDRSAQWGDTDGQAGSPLGKFVALTPAEFSAASGGELECWRLFHHDEELQAALGTWLQRSADATSPVPVHGDLRPDQFLVSPDGIVLVDWEEFTIGPRTRDLAGVVGALVCNALVRTFAESMVLAGAQDSAADLHRARMARGQQLLAATTPHLRRFLTVYEEQAGVEVDRRALAADVGWYLVERVVARSMLSHRLPAADKALAGVGRQALVDPAGLSRLWEDEA